MSIQGGLSTSDIATIFSEEIVAQGGYVTDSFDDRARLFLRAVLPTEREVRKRDRVQGGVALRATEDDIWVHPYVFRQVCRNGAIIARATQTRHIERTDFSFDPELARTVRDAVAECCAPEAFETATLAIRSSVHSPIDTALTMLPMIARMPAELRAQILGPILEGLRPGSSRSRFEVMNIVTAVARDTVDPEIRWRLEEIGGAVPFDVHLAAREILNRLEQPIRIPAGVR